MYDIKELYKFYNQKKSEIKSVVASFSKLQKEEYFYELCYCLLTPATKAQNVYKVVEYLKTNLFFEEGFDPTHILRGDVFKPIKIYVRFHHQKANRLLNARENWQLISTIINKNNHAKEKREELVTNVLGFGYKEASHFLRNIGHLGLAVLDRHILKNLLHLGVLNKIPNVGSRKKYLETEKIFTDFAYSIDIPSEELDLLLWAKETGYVLK